MHLFNTMRMPSSNQYFMPTSSAYVSIQQFDKFNNLSLTTQGTMNPTIEFLLIKLNVGIAGFQVSNNLSLSRVGCV